MNTPPISYRTPLTAAECIAAITAQPWEYGDELMPLWYHCADAGAGRLFVTFRGGKFRKIMRSRYLLTFTEGSGETTVTLEFQNELLGAPPMTPIKDVDLFLEQKLRAVRI